MHSGVSYEKNKIIEQIWIDTFRQIDELNCSLDKQYELALGAIIASNKVFINQG